MSMGFFRQEYWSGLPCPPLGDLPDRGIESTSPALQMDSLLLSHWESPRLMAWICLQCRRPGFDPWVGKILWRRKWQAIPRFLPGEVHGQRSLVGYNPWSHKELDMTEHTHMHVRKGGHFFFFLLNANLKESWKLLFFLMN